MKITSTFLASLLCVVTVAQSPCISGMAGGTYSCQNIDLMSFMSTSSIGGGSCLNDCWGWTDPVGGNEYAVVCGCSGTAFIDITDPVNPILLGNLPTHTFNSSWRDVKVYSNHAFIVSEASNHGLQVFDLTRLRNVPSPPVTFTEDAHFGVFGKAHNIAINEATGTAYVVGANSSGSPANNGGLVIIDITNPTSPVLAGSYTNEGYIHDAQCVVYNGPDTDHVGKEICINSHSGSPDKKSIVDVSDPTDVQFISNIDWPGARIGHQGWLSEDHKYFFLGDEGDESFAGHNTRTYVFDVQDLDAPILVGHHSGTNGSIDHNMYTHEGLIWQANYSSGLQVLEPIDLTVPSLQQVGWFDTHTAHNGGGFDGAWSNYPYFPSGNIIISDFDNGFFVVRPVPTLELNVLLGGALDVGTGLMNDGLRVAGLIPLTEPYTALGNSFVGGGGEVANASVFTASGNDAIIDWVIVELRAADNNTSVEYSRAALLQRDGDIVDVDGTSALRMDVAVDQYYVVVKHRNHLGVMTEFPQDVSITSEAIDLSDGSVTLFGTDAVMSTAAGAALWPGNVYQDGLLKYIGQNNDREPILVDVGGSIPTSTATGYYLSDVTMDGIVKYTGQDNDRDPILVGIGGAIPTNTRVEQLP